MNASGERNVDRRQTASSRRLVREDAGAPGLVGPPAKMTKFEIVPVRDVSLSDVAEFLCRWHDEQGEVSSPRAVRKNPASIERCLKWLLLENPLTDDSSPFGFCARDTTGVIRGLTLNFPNAFVLQDTRVLSLCSGSYFVEPQVRTAGFYLFKRYLDSSGYGFFFATTCNANSGVIWHKVRGSAVPNTETEYILPLRFGVMLPAFLGGKSSSRIATGLVSTLGRCCDIASKLYRRRSARLAVEPCRDWEKLADLSRRHRSAKLMTAERSARILGWRYSPSSPNPSADICVFRDKQGNEGWFALGTRMLGRQGQVRGSMLLDAVWPSDKMSFGDLLPAIVQRVAASADAVYLPPRPGVDYGEASRWIIPRTLEAPRVWALAAKGAPLVDWSCLDLVMADGDSGWSNRFENEPAGLKGNRV